MVSCVLQTCSGEGQRNLFIPRVPFRLGQVRVEVVSRQQCCPLGALDDGLNNAIYGRGIVQEDVVPHKITSPPSQFQIKYDDVGSVEEDCLKREVFCLAVEYGDTTTMEARSISHKNPIYHTLSYVYSPHDRRLLEDSNVHIFLRYSVQDRFEAAVL